MSPLWLAAAVVAGLSAPTACGDEVIQAIEPAPQIPADLSDLQCVSPNRRFVVFETYGPASGCHNQHAIDLQGKVEPRVFAPTWSPTFSLDSSALVVWPYDCCTGYLEPALVPLPTGEKASLDPAKGSRLRPTFRFLDEATGKTVSRSDFRYGPKTDHDMPDHRRIAAIRLGDGREFRVHPSLWSPDGRRRVYGRLRRAYQVSFVHVTDGRHERRLLAGTAVGWLKDGQHLVVRHSRGLFRLNVDTGAERYLGRSGEVRISPSTEWLAVRDANDISLVRTDTGERVHLPLEGLSQHFWGATDRELYCRIDEAWHRIVLNDGLTGDLPAGPEPEPLSFAGSVSRFQLAGWAPIHPLCQTYVTTADIKDVARIDGDWWLGTSGGLRIVNGAGADLPQREWQAGLLGYIVDQIVLDGDFVWLGTRRMWQAHRGGSFDNYLFRLDRRTGELRRAKQPWFGISSPFLLKLERVGSYWVELWRYGGLSFINTLAKARTRLSHKDGFKFSVRDMDTSPGGSVWVATRDGLLRFRHGPATAELWTAEHGLACDHVLSVAVLGDDVWVGTAAGLSRIDTGSGQAERLVAADVLEDRPILQICAASDTLYVRTPEWLAARAPEDGSWQRWDLPPGQPADLHAVDGMLLGDFGEKAPLQRFDGNGGWVTIVEPPTGQIISNRIRALDWREDTMWCGTVRGVSRLDPVTDEIASYPIPLKFENMTHMAADDREVWFTTSGGALLRIDRSTGAVRKITDSHEALGWGPTGYPFYAVAPTEGDVFVMAGKLLKINRASHAVEVIDWPFGDYTRQLVARDPDALWLRTRTALCRLGLPELSTTLWPLDPGDHAVAVGPDGVLWAAMWEHLEFRRPTGELIARWDWPKRRHDAYHRNIAATPDALWIVRDISHEDVRLLRFDLATGEWRYLCTPIVGPRQLLVVGDSVWLSGMNGLARVRISDYAEASQPL